jgi:RNA polymerase I-specific transcription initiation factor RRN7
LHLLLLRNPPPPEPWDFLHEQEDKRTYEQSFGNASAPAPNKHTQYRGPKGTSNENREKTVPSGNDSSDSDDDDDAQKSVHRESADPALAALLREASESSDSSSNDDENSPHGDNEDPSKPTKKKRQKNRYELPISNLAVLVLACWTMRLPIIYMDVIRYTSYVSVSLVAERNDDLWTDSWNHTHSPISTQFAFSQGV